MNNTITVKGPNCNYAPGLPTYAVDGEQGQQGENGNNIFYTNISIINDVQTIIQQIKNNYYPLQKNTVVLSRLYQDGDFFFDNIGIIWKLINYDGIINSSNIGKYSEYFQQVGYITLNNSDYVSLLSSTNRIIMDTSNYSGFDIVVGTLDPSTVVNKSMPMNIASNIVDSDDNIQLMLFSAVKSGTLSKGDMQIYFDTTTNTFHLLSENPIFIDSDVLINDTSNYVEYDGYNKIITTTDSITSFKSLCDKFVYDITADSSGNNYVEISVKDASMDTSGKLDLLNELQCKNNIYIKLYDSSVNQYMLEMNPEVKTYNLNTNVYNIIPFDTADISSFGTERVYIRNYSSTNISDSSLKDINFIVGKNINTSTADISIMFDSGTAPFTDMSITDINVVAGIYKTFNSSGDISTIIKYMPINMITSCYDADYVNEYKPYIFEFTDLGYADTSLCVTYSFNFSNEVIGDTFTELYMPLKDSVNLVNNKKYKMYYNVKYDTDSSILYTHVDMLTDTIDVKDSIDPNNPVISTELPSYITDICKVALLYNTEIFLDVI